MLGWLSGDYRIRIFLGLLILVLVIVNSQSLLLSFRSRNLLVELGRELHSIPVSKSLTTDPIYAEPGLFGFSRETPRGARPPVGSSFPLSSGLGRTFDGGLEELRFGPFARF